MPAEWNPTKQNCLLIPSGTANDPDRHHLFVILTDKCAEGFHLAVSVSSIKEGVIHDSTCVLEPGCHDFIDKKSFVLYARIQKLRSDLICKCVSGWTYHQKPDMTAPAFDQILEGVANSPFTPRWAKKYLSENS